MADERLHISAITHVGSSSNSTNKDTVKLTWECGTSGRSSAFTFVIASSGSYCLIRSCDIRKSDRVECRSNEADADETQAGCVRLGLFLFIPKTVARNAGLHVKNFDYISVSCFHLQILKTNLISFQRLDLQF